MKLKEKREKIVSRLKDITGKFTEIEGLLSTWQKRNGVRGLGKNADLKYILIKGFEQISATYTDEEGNTYEIRINYKNKKT